MMSYPFYIQYDEPRFSCLLDQNFGLGLTPRDYLTRLAIPKPIRHYCRPFKNLQAVQDAESTIKPEKNKFQVNLDVQHFAPEDISVKTTDGYLIVEAKHEEKLDDHGYISRSFTRRYPFPEGIEADQVTSKLSPGGVSSVTAPLKLPPNVCQSDWTSKDKQKLAVALHQ